MKEGRLFNVRRLVALDMGLHGPTFILIEFGLSVPVSLILGWFLFTRGFLVLGTYIVTLGVNYVPPLIYAVALREDYGEVVDMKDPEVSKLNHKYSIQQFLMFVPFFVVVLAVVQRLREA